MRTSVETELHTAFLRVSEVPPKMEFGRRRKPKPDTCLLSECDGTEARNRESTEITYLNLRDPVCLK